MAYRKPHTMDEFAKICIKGDTKLRQTVGTDLVAYLADDDNPIECEDIGAFIDALVQWTQGSNYKVSFFILINNLINPRCILFNVLCFYNMKRVTGVKKLKINQIFLIHILSLLKLYLIVS